MKDLLSVTYVYVTALKMYKILINGTTKNCEDTVNEDSAQVSYCC